ncbi:MAG: hypothetical protein BRC22_00285 [Parcubacteria group bacterium QH_9_35_7]|nr:MAG: hypothetical protein BRC22_00285 [Parcubacteria group bacterium QH_9_35_7]
MEKFDEAYVVTVDMGYGHQRAAKPLKEIAASPPGWQGEGGIITANNYAGIPKSDRNKWHSSRRLYEIVSRIKHLPIIGEKIFGIMDYLQRIEPFYPKRDLSEPTFQLKQIYRAVRGGLGKDLIDILNKDPKPYFTTFFTTAFFAEEHGYNGEIYCLCTDTDIARTWAPLNPEKSEINYLAPTRRARERLELYGVNKENIYTTGFSLPKENIGDEGELMDLRQDLGCRIANLDPDNIFQRKYEATLKEYLGEDYCGIDSDHPLTITFAVGGAGAQRELGTTILDSLHKHINRGDVRLNLIAGARNDVYRYYQEELQKLELQHQHGEMLNIIFDSEKQKYFEKFNQVLKTTDILWTKPSELTFYSALGVPIIMAPPIGCQEEFNREWLLSIGAGFDQGNPEYTHEWLFDWLESGWLAEAAMEGFLDAPINGTENIEDVILKGKRSEIEEVHLL